jgi:aminoglycoside phosphotransferase (APT) family kinase protein
MSETLDFLELLRRDGRVSRPDATITPLSGGVSSDVFLVRDGADRFVVKRALAKLRVRDDWFADIHRNGTELEYIRQVGAFLPEAVPQIRFASAEGGYFAMEYLADNFVNWKQMLLAGRCEPARAAIAGTILGTIHRKTAGDTTIARLFDTTPVFHQLRTDAYLLTTGRRHPALQEHFVRAAERIESTRECLVHGDYSPKNMLASPDRFVILDCETAWYGDPVFDLGFFLNHLLLKSLHLGNRNAEITEMISEFWQKYNAARSLSQSVELEKRLVPLLMMLLLARVDGKSPAEYLTPPKQQFIREFVTRNLPNAPERLDDFVRLWLAAR